MGAFTKFPILRTIASYSAILLLSKGLTLFSNYFLALNVSDKSFGLIALAQAGFLTALALLGLNASSAYVRYYYSHGFIPVIKALRVPYYVLIVSALVASVWLAIYFREDSEKIWFATLPVAGLIGSWLVSAGAVSRCANDIVGYALSEVGRPVIVFISLLVYVWGGLDIAPFIFYAVVFLVAVLVVFAIAMRRLLHLENRKNVELRTAELITYLLPLTLVRFTSVLNSVGDRYFLSAYVSLAEIGLYSKAYLLGSSLGMLFDSISLLWSPYIMKHREKYKKTLHGNIRKIYRSTVILSIVFLFAAFVAADAVSFPSERLRKLVIVTLLVIAAYFSRIGYQIFVPVLCAFDKTKDVARITIFGALIGVLANLLLIPYWGIYGAAIATLISFAITSVGTSILVNKTDLSISADKVTA